MKRPKVVILVKYFMPLKIVSGNIGFYKQLLPKLAGIFDLHVITYNKSDSLSLEKRDGYVIHRVRSPFLLNGTLLARKLKPDLIIFGTGIWKAMHHFAYSSLLKMLIFDKKVALQQNVALRQTSLFLRFLPFFYKSIFCAGEHVTKQFLLYHHGAINIQPGINKDNLRKLKEISKGRDIRIGFFGQYIEHKSPEELIEVFTEINPTNAELFMAAHNIGNFKQERIIPKIKGRKDIIAVGYLTDIYSYINSCDIVVVPFKIDYSILGIAQTAIDAMALGKAVVAYDSATLRPLIENGVDGYLYRTKDELKMHLSTLLRDKEKRLSFGLHARNKIMNNFNIDDSAKKMGEEIERIISRP